MDLRKGNRNLKEYDHLTRQMKVLETNIIKLENKLKRTGKNLRVDKETIRSRFKDACETRDSVEQRRFAELLRFQNRYIEKRLPDEKQQHMPQDVRLPVFCVSNTHYQWLREGGLDKTLKGFKLGAEETEIPRLRAHALSLPAATILRNVEEYHNGPFAELIASLGFWADPSPVRERSALLAIVERPRKVHITAYHRKGQSLIIISHDLRDVLVTFSTDMRMYIQQHITLTLRTRDCPL